MPGKAKVTGILRDINDRPIVGGTIIAEMKGVDTFELGTRIAAGRVPTTTGADGAWEIDLIVSAEGAEKSTTWTISGYDALLTPVFAVEGLFIASTAPIRLDHLQATSEANRLAAQGDTFARVLAAPSHEDYLEFPDRRDDDLVVLIDDEGDEA